MSALGFTRLNQKKQHPNQHITFIKPLPGPSEAIAQDFLNRIAAQCLPVMRKHHIFVRSLEEYEPNREFVGRNFNAGEVIQLVLKSRTSGLWLPFEYVQMVMMHELAHCKQMNHSKSFWQVRNQYAAQMQSLWAEGYTGDAIWGRGHDLETGSLAPRPTILPSEPLPPNICGGTYRTRSRKRRRGNDVKTEDLMPAERSEERRAQKARRILKKFGPNGLTLGDDPSVKAKLEPNRRQSSAKPRVAQSQRGRDLRAAAALARFETAKATPPVSEAPDAVVEISDSEDDAVKREDDDDDREGLADAVDIDGKPLVDKDGRGLVKVCEDDDGGGASQDEATREQEELLSSFRRIPNPHPKKIKKEEHEDSSSTSRSTSQPSIVDMFQRAASKKTSR